MGTITVSNKSTLTDRAALSIAADYYNDRDDEELQQTLKELKVKISKKGHKFTILDVEGSDNNE